MKNNFDIRLVQKHTGYASNYRRPTAFFQEPGQMLAYRCWHSSGAYRKREWALPCRQPRQVLITPQQGHRAEGDVRSLERVQKAAFKRNKYLRNNLKGQVERNRDCSPG